MADITLRKNLAESGQFRNIGLRGIADNLTTESIVAELYWRFEDDPTMPLQFLGEQRAGGTLTVPFNLDKDVRLFMVSRTADGMRSVLDPVAGEQLVVSPTAIVGSAPTSLTVDSVTPSGSDIDVKLDWTNNGGTGSNIIELKKSSGIWQIRDTVAAATATATITVFDIEAPNTFYWRVRNTSADGYSNIVSNYWDGT